MDNRGEASGNQIIKPVVLHGFLTHVPVARNFYILAS